MCKENHSMSEQKQIDEIAKLICVFPQCIYYNIIGECANKECQFVDNAEHLYNAGYRKQSDGEWIKINPNNSLIGEYYCSCCNSVIDIADGKETPLDREMYYCPNCGAKMKGGEE